MHVALWLDVPVPRQLFCDVRVRVRVLVPLVVQLPWQDPQSPYPPHAFQQEPAPLLGHT